MLEEATFSCSGSTDRRDAKTDGSGAVVEAVISAGKREGDKYSFYSYFCAFYGINICFGCL